MTNESNIYGMPNTGCLLGTAYQTLIAQLGEALRQSGLDISVPEYLVLRTLYSSDGLQQCEIASTIGKDKGAISRTVASMVKKGLVRTEPVSHKCLRVYVDVRGREIEQTVHDVARARHQALEAMVTEREMQTFVCVLRKIIQNQTD